LKEFTSIQANIFTVAGAVGVTVATGAYAAGRGIQTLVDRGQHQQTLGLNSPTARSGWLGIVGGVTSVVSGGTMAAAAAATRAAKAIPLAAQIAIKSVAVGSSVVNGLVVSNELANIIVKALNEEEITALDEFQFKSSVLFLTHSVISTVQVRPLINSVGENSSGGFVGVIKALMKRISEIAGPTKTVGFLRDIVGYSLTVLTIAAGKVLSLLSVCHVVGRKLMEIANSLLTSMHNCVMEVGELLGQFWESWNKEMAEVIDTICRAFGVKDWSELVIRFCRLIEFGHIRKIASILITERRSLVDGGSIAMTSHKRQAVCDKSAVVDTDNGPNRLVDGENPNCVRYYDEVTNIHAKFVDQQMCRNPADFCKYMMFVCKFVKSQLRKKKSNYEKTWEMVKDVKNVDDFKKQYGISGDPDNHFLQEVFDEFRNKEQDAFTLLLLTYMNQNAGTTAQQEEQGQGFLDAEGARFYPFYSIRGKASNGMPSEQQYREMAAKLTGRSADRHNIHISASGDMAVIQATDVVTERSADRDSIYISASSDTAVIQATDVVTERSADRDSIYISASSDTAVIQATDVVMVRCWLEDGNVSGIAAVLRTSSE
jgi:hypothetical protein